MTHVSPLAVGACHVTGMLTMLPYNIFKSYCANTKLNLIYRYDDSLDQMKQTASKC